MTTPQPPRSEIRMRGFGPRAPVEAVLATLDTRTAALAAEKVHLLQAGGRVLASAVVSPVDVPSFARAAMDGYAIRAEDTVKPVPLVVRGEAMPARPFAEEARVGEAVRITTGAPIPSGANAVLMAELAQLEADGRVLPRTPIPVGKHVVRVGEDVPKGREVLSVGRRLRPQDIGLLASIGVGTVVVHRRPRVAILVTGNELLPPGAVPEGFRIVDSNSPMLTALVTRDGGEALAVRYLPDDYAAVRDAIANTDADVILVSGGTSVGTEDHAPRVVAELGELTFHGIALRPAGPTGIGFLPRLGACEGSPVAVRDREDHPPLALPHSHTLALLLPGNPISCLCAYDLFAGRVVRRLGGRGWALPYRQATLPLAGEIVSAAERVDYVRVKVESGKVVSLGTAGASNLSSAVAADGFTLIPADCERVEPGALVEVWFYDGP